MDSEKIYFTVSAEDVGERLDKYLDMQLEEFSRSTLQKLCEDNRIFVNSKSASKNYKLRLNDEIEVNIPEPVELDLIPQDIPLEIVYEDSSLLVVNKPKDMVVHPAAGNPDGTLVNALLFHCKGRLSTINGVIRPGIVHRIDKDTSGLLVVAKNDRAHASLSAQIKEHSFDRYYHAMVYGNVKNEEGMVEAPIGRHPNDRKKMCVTDKNSREATTYYEVVDRYKEFTHLRLKLKTGRTHQIRVHMAHIHHPVAGDVVYGPKKVLTSLKGQCLHAASIGFVHPETNEFMHFTADLPDYFKDFINKQTKTQY